MEWLFHTAATMQRKEQQCDRQRCPHQATVAKEMVPEQLSVQAILGSVDKDILEVAEDIYHSQYQLAPSIFTHQHLDLLMQELHKKLDQRLVRTGLCSTTCSGRFPSRGRAHSCVHPQTPLNPNLVTIIREQQA